MVPHGPPDPPPDARGKKDIRDYAFIIQEAECLENKANLAVPHPGREEIKGETHPTSIDAHGTPVRSGYSRDDIEEGGLAAAGFSRNRADPTGLDVKVYTRQDSLFHSRDAVLLFKTCNLQHRHAATSGHCPSPCSRSASDGVPGQPASAGEEVHQI